MTEWQFIGSVAADAIGAAIAAIGFSVISNPPRRVIPCTAILAAIGHSIRFVLLQYAGLDLASASFIAAFSIGLLSHFSAYKLFCPATVLYIPALLPMIPGMYAYRTVFSLIKFLQRSNPLPFGDFQKRYNDSLCFIRISCRSNYTYIHFLQTSFHDDEGLTSNQEISRNIFFLLY